MWLPVAAEERDWADSLADEGLPWSQGVQGVELADLHMERVQGQPNRHFGLAMATNRE